VNTPDASAAAGSPLTQEFLHHFKPVYPSGVMDCVYCWMSLTEYQRTHEACSGPRKEPHVVQQDAPVA
jgi:hypothetical protein